MARNKINISRPVLFAALLTAGVILLLIPQSITMNFNFVFRKFFTPALNIGRQKEDKAVKRKMADEDFVPREQYNELWKAFNNTYAALMKAHEDNERLAKIRLSLPKPGPAFVPVGVINSSISNFKHELFVNKGSMDGLKVGQYVMCDNHNSIIGTVCETDETTSRIHLLTDVTQRIEVCIWREGRVNYISAQMAGDGKTGCKIPFISREHDVKAGDTVFAAARTGFLDVPIVIGEVSEVLIDQDKPLLWDITVIPIEDAFKLTKAVVIVSEVKKDN